MTISGLSRFLVMLILLLCIRPLHAGLFDNEESLNDSQKKAKKLTEHIPSGRIVVTNADGTIVHDYATGTVIGKPNETKTHAVLSCAHTYHAWKQPENKFYFYDHLGNKHVIDRVEALSTQLLDVTKDIAIYHLKDPLKCNPKIKIAQEAVKEAKLSSLSYGWALTINQPFSFCNINPILPYYLEDTLQFYDSYYASSYEALEIFSIEERYNIIYSYLPNYSPKKAYQSPFFRHDSGSAWFSGNEEDGYTLSALSSEIAKVEESDIASATSHRSMTKLTVDKDHEFSFHYYKMEEPQTYWNCYAALAPHWDWIQARL